MLRGSSAETNGLRVLQCVRGVGRRPVGPMAMCDLGSRLPWSPGGSRLKMYFGSCAGGTLVIS